MPTRLSPTLGAAALLMVTAAMLPAAPDPAPKHPVTDEYHGVKVQDDYQWLEKADDPEVKKWVAEQNKVTRAYFDTLPDRAAAEKQLTELYAKVSPNYTGLVSRPGNQLFALKFQPPKQQPLLVMLKSTDDTASEKVVLDVNEIEPKGKTAIDWFVPSVSGKLIAVSLSKNGSEDGTLYFYRTDTGERLPEEIPHVQYPTAGGSAAWIGDFAVYYTRFPRPGERPEADLNFYQQVWLHEIAKPYKEDVYCLGKDFPRIAEITLEASNEGRILVTVANGDGGDFSHYLSKQQGGWRQITRDEDGVKEVAFGRDRTLYLRSVKNAPRGMVLRLPFEAELKDAVRIVPESPDAVIESITPTATQLYVTDLVGGPSRIRRFDLNGENGQEIPVPPISAIQQIVALPDYQNLAMQNSSLSGDRVLFRQISYTSPFAWYLYDPKAEGGGLRKTALVGTSPVDFSDIEAVREFATSKDGTKIPLNILRHKGTKLDGSNPTLLYGYGGYGINMQPNFSFVRRLWFDRGGVYVVANLRGGGEFGEAWHQAGNLTRKQNVFDDFAAAAQYLIKAGYTNSGKLAVEGGSNGGLLMGAFLTQNPGLARAVVTHVGIYDMLRVELDPNGAFNVTEFGTVKDPAQFKALYDYSPYHRVKDGEKYPAVFFMTGDNDGRVNPLHSRKMTARLQAANAAADHPIYLRTTAAAGHGMGTALTELIAQLADADAFLFDQLGMKAAQP